MISSGTGVSRQHMVVKKTDKVEGSHVCSFYFLGKELTFIFEKFVNSPVILHTMISLLIMSRTTYLNRLMFSVALEKLPKF